MGRRGDHPYTAVVDYDGSLYTESIREYVRAVDEYDDPGARHRAKSLLWDAWWDPPEEELQALESDLESLYREVGRADEYAAESPLEACLDDDPVYTAPVRRLVREVHDEIGAAVGEVRRGRNALSALLWRVGWDPDDPGEVESELREFRDDHWIWEK